MSVRAWLNGKAPAFQAGYAGSIPAARYPLTPLVTTSYKVAQQSHFNRIAFLTLSCYSELSRWVESTEEQSALNVINGNTHTLKSSLAAFPPPQPHRQPPPPQNTRGKQKYPLKADEPTTTQHQPSMPSSPQPPQDNSQQQKASRLQIATPQAPYLKAAFMTAARIFTSFLANLSACALRRFRNSSISIFSHCFVLQFPYLHCGQANHPTRYIPCRH